MCTNTNKDYLLACLLTYLLIISDIEWMPLTVCGLYRTLGSIVCIISERKNVHHSIISSLDSHDNVELEAAIYAASLFAAKSKYVAIHTLFAVVQYIEFITLHPDTNS